jgi:branched-chain amino acid transport system substrate-binding protein
MMRARIFESASPVRYRQLICSIRPAPALLRQTLTLLVILASAAATSAQTESTPSKPYAAINREAINYAGPDRDAAHDLPGPEIRIGLLAPLQGSRKAEGEALRQAALMALEDESAKAAPEGLRLVLVTRDETGLWGRASSEIVRLVIDDQAVALITSAEGNAAHLAEQVGNRLGVPVLTLSSDSTTTQINIPWLFRLVPSDAVQARVFAEDIYRERAFQKVLLIAERNHDGRVGREEFEKAARRLQAAPPDELEVALPLASVDSLLAEIRTRRPQAVVLWTSAETAAGLVEGMGRSESSAAIYVCRKALEEPFTEVAEPKKGSGVWFVTSGVGSATSSAQEFAARLRSRAGTAPSLAAAEVYDAVRLVAAGLRQSGPNRARLRDSLARVKNFAGVSGNISFDGAGNNRAEVVLASLE